MRQYKAILLILCVFMVSCEDMLDRYNRQNLRENSDFTIEQYETQTTIGVICDPECPPELEIYRRLDAIVCTFKEELDEGYRPWHRFTILFTNQDRPYIGQVNYDRRLVTISMNHLCDGYTAGLCPGVFDWEMGNVLLEWSYGERGRYWVPEAEKLQYRIDHELLYGCTPWALTEAQD